jgi:hypothetical protein
MIQLKLRDVINDNRPWSLALSNQLFIVGVKFGEYF